MYLFSGVVIHDKCTPNPCKYNGVCRTSEDGKRAFCKCPTYKFKAPFCGEYSEIWSVPYLSSIHT